MILGWIALVVLKARHTEHIILNEMVEIAMSVQLKRAYEPASKEDGYRVLVDRLWMRGVSKAAAKIDLWLKDIAPSTSLRKWFDHDPEKWNEFRKRYAQELDNRPEIVKQLTDLVEKQHVTLVYSAKNTEFNQAVALKEYLEMKQALVS